MELSLAEEEKENDEYGGGCRLMKGVVRVRVVMNGVLAGVTASEALKLKMLRAISESGLTD